MVIGWGTYLTMMQLQRVFNVDRATPEYDNVVLYEVHMYNVSINGI